MENFRINAKSHIRHLWLFIFLLVFVSLGIYYLMIFRYGGYVYEKAIVAAVAVLIVYFLPMILLHFNYYQYSKGDSFIYDDSQGLMIYNRRGIATKFRIKDVDSVVCFKSWPLAENRLPIFPWDIYNYAVINLKDGKILKISSLLVYEFDKKIRIDGIMIKKIFYPWIR